MREIRNVVGGIGNIMFKQAYLYAQMREGNIPDVYVQSHKYFDKYKEEIKQMYGDDIGFLPYVAIHIRRGDYHKGNFHTRLSETDYYERAVKEFEGKKFLVFCHDRQDPEKDKEDREWCQKYFTELLGEDNFQLVENETDIEDLNMMASCEGMIMANSTFGWWSAYLNPNHNKRIICPKEWFTDGVKRIDLLDEWKKI